ncbi:hypothetical protein FLM06_03860 [Vibrio cholerae]|nr:hypothetical protein FLM06_03860 [Vibrio cholerae]TQP03885.1 hypothetical protein FLL97_07185 [Vibrio cholerae]TQP49307.1 hypothetical protein FLL99_04610 [Vibrio cholerae]TQP69668.1 hypothetical protein FLL91_11650 [Vibrio cholerae]TQQ04234.1 hypothetical protein FLL72_15715 [Vibrio cholerae]
MQSFPDINISPYSPNVRLRGGNALTLNSSTATATTAVHREFKYNICVICCIFVLYRTVLRGASLSLIV